MIMKPVLVEHMTAIQRQFKNRHLTVGSSEIGRCARQTWYAKHDPAALATAEISHGATHRGTMIEAHTVVPALRRRFGANLLYAGKDQKSLVSGESSATPDGLLINLPKDFLLAFGVKDIGKDRCMLVEIKTIDPRIQLRGPKPEHERQALQQLGVMREVTKHRPEYCLLMYINASFMDDVTEFIVAYDDRKYQLQKERAKRILSAKTAREILPEGWIKGGRECDQCGFLRACIELRTAVPAASSKAADPQFIAEIKALAQLEREQDTIAGRAEEKKREIQVQIKDRLREKGLRGVKADDVSVSWYPVKARITFDTAALREAAEKAKFNLAPFEKTGEPSDGLRISIGDSIKPTAIAKEVRTK